MSFKPRKCHSIIIRQRQVQKSIEFQTGTEQIPTVNDEPIKCLEKWYDGSLRENYNSRKTMQQLQYIIAKIDKAALAWIY